MVTVRCPRAQAILPPGGRASVLVLRPQDTFVSLQGLQPLLHVVLGSLIGN